MNTINKTSRHTKLYIWCWVFVEAILRTAQFYVYQFKNKTAQLSVARLGEDETVEGHQNVVGAVTLRYVVSPSPMDLKMTKILTATAQLVTKWAWLSKSTIRGQQFSLARQRVRTTYSLWPYSF